MWDKFNRYPYINLTDRNLDFLTKAIREMEYEIKNFVSINAVKYANPIQWSINKQYEKNTIVIDPLTGTAFISVQPVPSGVSVTRTEYWTPVFDLSQFVTKAASNFANTYERDITTTATMPTGAGGWVVWDSTLYVALNAIHAGDAYVVGGNIKRMTVEDFYDLLMDAIHNLDEEIDTEIRNRTNADTVLQGNIDAEAQSREDADTVLQGNIDAEAQSREDADTVLQGNIDAETQSREDADTVLQGNIDALNRELDGVELDVSNNSVAINNIIAQSSLAGESNFLVVSKKGGRFTTINSAVEYAQTYCSEQNRVCIVIMSGVYNENITLFPNNGIDLLGVGDVTIQAEVNYPNSPLYVGGNITVENIKFLAFASAQATYGLHVEAAAENCYLKFVNCQFTAVSTSGAGIGMHNAMELTFINCKFISWSTNSVYAHNFPGPASAVGQKLRFFGCEFQSLDATASDAVIEDATYRMGYGGVTSRMDVSFSHSIFNKGQIQYIEVNDGVITTNQPFLPALGNVRLDVNSIATLYSVDFYKYTPHIKNSSYADAIGITVIPFNNANKYAWHIDEVKNQSGVTITSDANVFTTDVGGVTIQTPNNVSQNNIYTISGVPKV